MVNLKFLKKKLLKIGSSKFKKIPYVFLGGPVGGKFRTSFKTFGW